MITSDRNFGIEIEFFCENHKNLRSLGKIHPLIDDGSIRHVSYAAEYVSGVLSGASGEQAILKVCEDIKKHGGRADNQAMSVHVHLDGRRADNKVFISEDMPKEYRYIARVSNRLARAMPESAITERMLASGELGHIGGVQTTHFDDVVHYSLAKLEFKPTKNFMYFYTPKDTRFKWLRNMLYFYTLYSSVMEDMVSNSRRVGNTYCIPLGLSYDLDEIESTETMDGLKSLWYKGRSPHGHYDDSRYHNVNFHAFWDRHGTVEVRSHGGTVDPYKIILWTKLHQKIADKLEELELKDIKPKTPNLHKEFVKFVEEPILQAYVKRLVGYYSGVKIK